MQRFGQALALFQREDGGEPLLVAADAARDGLQDGGALDRRHLAPGAEGARGRLGGTVYVLHGGERQVGQVGTGGGIDDGLGAA